MPNDVYNKIIFDSLLKEKIFSECLNKNQFDFKSLIPAPLQMYLGDISYLAGEISSIEEEDFKCNWHSWCEENWGTKWNAYGTICATKDNITTIEFKTAWSVPYPVIVAFSNKYLIPFEHRYYEEQEIFWGIEKWDIEKGKMKRISKKYKDPEDLLDLKKEFNQPLE